jgi:lipopolysaccharide export system protein LptA
MDVKTSGLVFDQKTGVASTQQRVEFTTVQGSGSAVGATFDSESGQLLLSHALELHVRRGQETVQLRAQSATFNRGAMVCDLRAAEAAYRRGAATAGEAQIHFRPDGSALRLDARSGFTLTTATGARVAAPTGWLTFNEKNQPMRGQMLNGVTLESAGEGRVTRGTAPTAELAFSAAGDLRHAHLERGVTLHSEQNGAQGTRMVREWQSPVADVDFRRAGAGGQVALSQVHGSGGVVITSVAQRGNAQESPSRMAADEIAAQFGAHQELTQVVGMGHASLEQTTATGARETTSGDRVEARFAAAGKGGVAAGPASGPAQIASAVVDGHVVLTDQPASKPGQAAQAAMQAWAARAVYDGAGQWLHLTGEPRIEDGGLQLTANRVDMSQASGDAFARGNVKATWSGGNAGGAHAPGPISLGGQGPAHVVAAEAQLNKATGEATFRGQARLWQQANSIAAPVIVLNQSRQTLVARGSGAAHPVNLVLLSAGQRKGKAEVVQIYAGDLKYSEAERKAFLHGRVTAVTETATISSNEAEIVLLPPGNHAGPDGGAAQVERITAKGQVQVSSQGRSGTGEQLVYTGETGNYVLTGTAAAPPALTDPVRGIIRGEALIFNGRNDSVSIEGGGRKTTTETVAPR